jgi:hypothetical protein
MSPGQRGQGRVQEWLELTAIRGLRRQGAVGGPQFAEDLTPRAGIAAGLRVLDPDRGQGDRQPRPLWLPGRGHHEGFPRVAGGGPQVSGGASRYETGVQRHRERRLRVERHPRPGLRHLDRGGRRLDRRLGVGRVTGPDG